MADATDLFATSSELLDAAIDALDTLAPAFEGAPERAFVAPGRPALESCDQLTVHVDLVADADTSPGGLGAGKRRTGKVNLVTFVVTSSRCVKDTRKSASVAENMLQPYKMQDLIDTAQQVQADGWALWNHIYNLWRSEDLFTLCGEVFFDGLRALPEEGARAGWTLTLRVQVPGYDDVASS